jgi:hypothetical protein
LERFLGLCGPPGAVRLSPVEGEDDLPLVAGVMTKGCLSPSKKPFESSLCSRRERRSTEKKKARSGCSSRGHEMRPRRSQASFENTPCLLDLAWCGRSFEAGTEHLTLLTSPKICKKENEFSIGQRPRQRYCQKRGGWH